MGEGRRGGRAVSVCASGNSCELHISQAVRAAMLITQRAMDEARQVREAAQLSAERTLKRAELQATSHPRIPVANAIYDEHFFPFKIIILNLPLLAYAILPFSFSWLIAFTFVDVLSFTDS